ncbi:MAG: peptide chain release factor N(5)-glutamine methyltransferase [Rhodoblastus sp.]|nr:peptide chain release factor N(5)-glutamine methyltransferase [Rhodoblastus sp.]
MSRAEALAAGRGYLRDAQIEAANEDARILLLDACGIEPVALVTDGGRPLTKPEAGRFETSLDRRVAGEPASRIVGRRPFWTLDLAVRVGVLDPRADSEALVRLAVRIANRSGAPPRRILDLGCGSGALLCALLSEFAGAYGVGVDLSAEACVATNANIAACDFGDRAAVLRAAWCDALAGPFDLVVSNPPYIRAADIARLDREVRDHDPPLALDGGGDGLDAYRALFAAVPRILSPGGAFAVEFGFGQEGEVARLAAENGLRKIDGERDFSGRDRASAFAAA